MWVAVSVALLLATAALAEPTKQQLTEPGLSKMEELRYQVMLNMDNLWQSSVETNDINSQDMTDVKLMEAFTKLSKNITLAETQISRANFEPLTWELEFAQLKAQADSIGEYFETFRRLQKERVRWRHEIAWTDMALYFLDTTENGINRTMEKLHGYTLRTSGTSLFQKALQDSKSSICELQQSQQELIYQMYNMVSLSELKGYTMLNFAWMLLKIYDKGNFTTEAELLRKLYTERTLQKVNAAREAMTTADRSLYRCDPRKWTEGENYVRLTKMMQGYIENEVNLNPDGTCGQNCKFYDVAEYHGCFKEQFCARQRACHGQVLHCTYYDSDMNICQSSSSDRRYDFVEYENGMVLGTKGSCPNRQLVKVDSWWRYLFWHCSYCFCLCDDNHPSSDRFFSLREVTSDIANNKVITGVRLVKENQIIHIQIEEGVLQAGGVVNKTTAQWVPVKSFGVMDENVRNGVDFHTINYRQRGMDLDDAFAPVTHVLTGARFRRVGNHLNLEISATPFNFATGKLQGAEESLWIGNDNTDGSFVDPRKEVSLPDADIPTRHGPHLPDSKHDQFILFRESSLKKDVSQSTVPYLDSQPVQSGGVILSGLGVHHRGALNSGGVLALKLITYDYSPHMVPQTPEVA